MDKEFINEICQRGVGSRGGKGARKRRNGGVPSTRRHTAKENERENLRLTALGRNLKKSFSAEDADEADALLSDYFKLPAMETSGIPAFWAKIAAEPGALFVLMGDEQYREALKLVYALAVRVATSDQFDMHVRLISEHLANRYQCWTRKRQNRQIVTFDDLLRAIARLRIDFGNLDEEDDRRQVWTITASRLSMAS